MAGYWFKTSMAREVARNLKTTGWFQSPKRMECPTCHGDGVKTIRAVGGPKQRPCPACDGEGRVSLGSMIKIRYSRVAPPDAEADDSGMGAQVIGTELGVYEAHCLAVELWHRTVAEDPIPDLGDESKEWAAEHLRDARQALIRHFLHAAEGVAQIRWIDDPIGDDTPVERYVEQLVAEAVNVGSNLQSDVRKAIGAGSTYRRMVERIEDHEDVPHESEED